MKNKKFFIIGVISIIVIIFTVTAILLSKGSGYNKPYLPKGFEHLEGTVDEGYVIKHKATGNEFVWVPVDGNTIQFKRYDGNEKYLEENDDGLEESVAKYGGFYIARYEAGCEVADKRNYGASQELDALSKPNLNVYNLISRDSAIARAKEMATKQGFEGVQTRLMSAKSWDTTMSWLNTRNIDVHKATTEYGNYKNYFLQKTGSNENWCLCNIYDLAGNVSEWITDIYTENNEKPYLLRDKKSRDGGISPLMQRGEFSDGSETISSGFRVVLYK